MNKACMYTFKVLASILHLGNVEFTSDDECQITADSKKYILYAADLLDVDGYKLEQSILRRSIEVKSSEIM